MLLDTSGLLCCLDADETRHVEAVTLYDKAPVRFQIVDAFEAAHLPVTVLQARGAAIALNTPPSELEIFVGVK
jgi:hypothetical protein